MPLQSNIQKIESLMKARPGTVTDLAKRSALSITLTREIVGILFHSDKSHITSYATSGTKKFPVYAFGKGINAPAPGRFTPEERRERNRKYHAAKLAKKADEAESAHRARIREELARPAFRDPFIVALFGPYEARA